MNTSIKKTLRFMIIRADNPSRVIGGRVLKTILGLFLITFFIFGCEPAQVADEYRNEEIGIKFLKPHSWNVTYLARNGELVITSPKGQDNRDSVRIEIISKSCIGGTSTGNQSTDTILNITKSEVNEDIDRIRNLYGLDTISVLQDPTNVKTENYEALKAIVRIPTKAMEDDPLRIQVGKPNSELFQNITIFAINSPSKIWAYIYEGNSDSINSQAEQIINHLNQSC